MLHSEIQALVDQVKPLQMGRPFDLLPGPELPMKIGLRVHWHEEQQRWIFCTRTECARRHVQRPLRYARYLNDEGQQVGEPVLVLATPMLQREDARARMVKDSALIKFGQGIQTRYETCERKPS
jgi:hypothetical protein